MDAANINSATDLSLSSAIATSSPAMLYYFYHRTRLREEERAAAAPPKPRSRTSSRRRQVNISEPATTASLPSVYRLSRRQEFVGPTFQDEFIRRRLLEMEDQLNILRQNKEFEGVWQREVVEPLYRWSGVSLDDQRNAAQELSGEMGDNESREQVEITGGILYTGYEGDDDSDTGHQVRMETDVARQDDKGQKEGKMIPATTHQMGTVQTQGLESAVAPSASPPAVQHATKKCLTCKKNKKGCDRALPACGRCRKSGSQCDYYY